jgi:hypothetical protein
MKKANSIPQQIFLFWCFGLVLVFGDVGNQIQSLTHGKKALYCSPSSPAWQFLK